MITSLANSLKKAFDRSNPNSVPSMLASFAFGDFLRAMPTKLWGAAPTTDPYGPASNVAIFLPDDAKAEYILGAYARAGTGTAGPLTVVAYTATPSAGDICVDPAGNLLFHEADAWTSVDVRYIPKEGDVYELTLPVASGVVTFPANLGGITGILVTDVLEAQRADTSTANLQVTAPAATNTTTGTACLNLAKTQLLLDSGDNATSVRVKFLAQCAVNRNLALESASSFI